MAKRGLCILLALAAVFSLSAPALAEEEPVTAEEVVTEETVIEPEEVTEEVEAEPETVDTAIAVGFCGGEGDGTNLAWAFSADGVLTVSGTGKMKDYSYAGDDVPWHNYRKQIKTIVIEPGVTSIGDSAFWNCAAMTNVTIPSSVTAIVGHAFESCRALKNITIPNGVTRLGYAVFQSCDGLTSITIPASVTVIESGAAFNANNITDIYVDENSKSFSSVDGVLFNADKTALVYYPHGKEGVSYTIPDTVVSVMGFAFANCPLTSVTLSASVKAVASDSFLSHIENIYVANGNKCFISVDGVLFSADGKTLVRYPGDKEISAYDIPNTVTAIADGAFLYCGITSATVPASVTSIGMEAFNCTDLKSITILNPWCDIIGGDSTLNYSGETVVHGYDGSTAQAYAEKYGYTFQSLGPSPVTPTPKPTATPKPTNTPKPGTTPTPTPTAVPKLAAPTVKIEKVSTGIKVTWNKVAGSPRYMVYYKEGNGSWKKIGTTTSTTYTRAAKYLKSGATYQFTVRCCANDKKTLLGPYKASNSLKYTAQLAAPTVKIAKVAGGIKVSWNKITGSPRYMVYYKENGGGWKKIGTTTSTTYTRAAKYLKSGVTYQFTVRCCANDKKTLLGPYKASNSLKYTK